VTAQAPVRLPWLEVGRRTYWARDVLFKAFLPGERIVIGGFCSIADRVVVLAGGNRRTDAAALFPLDLARTYRTTGTTRIGNDVWIATGATILGGTEIGDGAIVAAGAVVSQDVPPFALAAGSPARVVRHRFAPELVERLLRISWWDWPDEKIAANIDAFYGPIEAFVERFDPGGT
jgi:acetyltransferase-like isoleucine patch superfamily enzyme